MLLIIVLFIVNKTQSIHVSRVDLLIL